MSRQTHLENTFQRFMTASPVEVVKQSLSFPEPKPGLTFTTSRRAGHYLFVLYVDGRQPARFLRTKEHTALIAVKRLLGLGYALTNDAAKLVSPLSTYSPQ